jgi:hypothetical protein
MFTPARKEPRQKNTNGAPGQAEGYGMEGTGRFSRQAEIPAGNTQNTWENVVKAEEIIVGRQGRCLFQNLQHRRKHPPNLHPLQQAPCTSTEEGRQKQR